MKCLSLWRTTLTGPPETGGKLARTRDPWSGQPSPDAVGHDFLRVRLVRSPAERPAPGRGRRSGGGGGANLPAPGSAQATRTTRTGSRQHVPAEVEHLRSCAPEPHPVGPPRRPSRPRRRTPSSPAAPRRRDQRHRPAEQPLQRRHRPRGHHVEPVAAVQLLGPPARHLHLVVQPQARRRPRRGSVVRRSSGSTGSPAGRAGRSPAPGPGRPAPEPTSTTRRPARDRLAQHRAVQQVPVPQPGRLAGTDQAPHDAVGGQQVGVPLGQGQPVRREHPPRHAAGDGGCFT